MTRKGGAARNRTPVHGVAVRRANHYTIAPTDRQIDPHCSTHIENLEKVQKRAGRFITGNYKMESGAHRFNLDLLGWPKLEVRRLQIKLTLFQKTRLNLIDIPTDHLAIKFRQTRQGVRYK